MNVFPSFLTLPNKAVKFSGITLFIIVFWSLLHLYLSITIVKSSVPSLKFRIDGMIMFICVPSSEFGKEQVYLTTLVRILIAQYTLGDISRFYVTEKLHVTKELTWYRKGVCNLTEVAYFCSVYVDYQVSFHGSYLFNIHSFPIFLVKFSPQKSSMQNNNSSTYFKTNLGLPVVIYIVLRWSVYVKKNTIPWWL